MRDSLCIIGARKGSKRFPGKNKAVLKNKPLFQYAIDVAREAEIFHVIIFSTDDEEILGQIVGQKDILADKRPGSLAGDDVVMWDVGTYLLEKYSHLIDGIENLCFLSPCHPLKTAKHLREAYTLYKESMALSVVGMTAFPSPPELQLEVVDGNVVRNWDGPTRKGEYTTKYYPNGVSTFVNKDYFLKTKGVYSERTKGYEIEWPHCLDIDYEKNLVLADKLNS